LTAVFKHLSMEMMYDIKYIFSVADEDTTMSSMENSAYFKLTKQ